MHVTKSRHLSDKSASFSVSSLLISIFDALLLLNNYAPVKIFVRQGIESVRPLPET
jgi:hypothetical protein